MKRRLLCIALAVCLVLAGCVGCKKKKDGEGGGFRFPIDGEPVTLDPQMATDTASITVLGALFEGLTRVDDQGMVQPAAATWTVSEDGLTYTFTLRDARWNANPTEGESHPWDEPHAVTAEDFVFAIQRLADPATGSPLAREVLGIQNAREVLEGQLPVEQLGVTATDSTHLTITLSAPDETFLSRLASSPFYPCHRDFFEYTAGRYGLEEAYLLTNGPFRLAAWNHDESLLLYKFEEYRDAANVSPEAVRFVIGTEDYVRALDSGDLAAAPLTPRQAAKVEDTVTLQDAVRCLWLNTSYDALSVTQVRQALRDSIQWDSLDAYLREAGETVATGYVPLAASVDGHTYRTEAYTLPRTTDATAAQTHLREGLALYAEEGKTPPATLHLELLAPEDGVSADLARYILQSWQKHLGLSVTLTLLDEATLAARVRSGNYQAALYTYVPAGPAAAQTLSAFASTASDNLSRLHDTAVDAAVAAALQGDDTHVWALEQLLWEQCPALPIGFPCRYYGFADNVDGILVRPFEGGRYQSPLDFRHAKQYD